MSRHFQSLTIRDVRRETNDCVSISFDVPTALAESFRFIAGQYVNLRAIVDGEELRRSYSICSAPHSGELRVAVKRVEGGRFSEFANTKLKIGDVIDVMPPDGKFCFEPEADAKQNVLAVAAGSGITPILSIVTTLLEEVPSSSVALVYGNRRVRDIMFKEQIEDLRDRFLNRFQLIHVLSQEPQESPINNGRIDRKRIETIINKLGVNRLFHWAYICGPESMTDEVIQTLGDSGMSADSIHRERFSAGPHAWKTSPLTATKVEQKHNVATSQVTVIADGIERVLRVPFEGESILEIALAAGIDAQFACKAGVCCTCRAQVLKGAVKMDANFTLEQHEVGRGFVLTCQSHPTTEHVKISFDAR
jgi:ring-1,2-phenylacetyl-CoA epoxidase subunit PaaE